MLVVTVYYLYAYIWSRTNSTAFFQQLRDLLSANKALFLVSLLLVIPNILLETQKWVVLTRIIEPQSFNRAFQAVAAGITLGLITPNKVGDYAARALLLNNNHRLKSVGAVFLSRMCQLQSTVLFGSAGFVYYLVHQFFIDYTIFVLGVIISLIMANIFFLVFLYNSRLLVPLFGRVRFLRSILPALFVLQRYTTHIISKVILLSNIRYMVFCLQFMLLLFAMGTQLSWLEAFAGAAATFLLKSVVPSFTFLSDIGIREVSALQIFGLLGQSELKVITASLLLWLINIALPALCGLAVIMRLKIANLRK